MFFAAPMLWRGVKEGLAAFHFWFYIRGIISKVDLQLNISDS